MSVADDIAALEELINTAVDSTSSDGQHTAFNLPEARRRLAQLKAQQAGSSWPRFSTINLSSGFDE